MKNYRSYLYKLMNNYNNNNYYNNNIDIFNKYLNEYNNKGTKLQNSNKNNNWNNQLYKFNKNNIMDTILIDNLVSKLISKLFKIIINPKDNDNIIKDIYINKPKFKHTIKTVYINFNYTISQNNINKLNNKHNYYYTSLINNIYNLLLKENNNNNNNYIIKYLSKLYNKKVIIIPNNIKYHYNDNIILNKTIINNIESYKGGLSGKYNKILKTNVPINNNLLIKNKYISNIIKFNNIKYNNIINNNNNIKNIYNNININNISNNLLINKYIIGLNILYKGKNLNKAGVSRSIKDKLLFGSLSNKLYSKYNGLLIYKNNNNLLFNHNFSINKKYNLNYIPNHHSILTNHKINKNKTGVFGLTTKLNTI